MSEITPIGRKTARIKSVNHSVKFYNDVKSPEISLHGDHSKRQYIDDEQVMMEYPLKKKIKNCVLDFVNKRAIFVINGTLGKLTMCVMSACLRCNFVVLFYLI